MFVQYLQYFVDMGGDFWVFGQGLGLVQLYQCFVFVVQVIQYLVIVVDDGGVVWFGDVGVVDQFQCFLQVFGMVSQGIVQCVQCWYVFWVGYQDFVQVGFGVWNIVMMFLGECVGVQQVIVIWVGGQVVGQCIQFVSIVIVVLVQFGFQQICVMVYIIIDYCVGLDCVYFI